MTMQVSIENTHHCNGRSDMVLVKMPRSPDPLPAVCESIVCPAPTNSAAEYLHTVKSFKETVESPHETEITLIPDKQYGYLLDSRSASIDINSCSTTEHTHWGPGRADDAVDKTFPQRWTPATVHVSSKKQLGKYYIMQLEHMCMEASGQR